MKNLSSLFALLFLMAFTFGCDKQTSPLLNAPETLTTTIEGTQDRDGGCNCRFEIYDLNFDPAVTTWGADLDYINNGPNVKEFITGSGAIGSDGLVHNFFVPYNTTVTPCFSLNVNDQSPASYKWRITCASTPPGPLYPGQTASGTISAPPNVIDQCIRLIVNGNCQIGALLDE